MTIDELLSLAGLTANDEIPVWDAEAVDEPTKKITAQNLAASVKALAGLVGEAEFTEQIVDKASAIVDTVSGAIASFPDGAAVAAKDITIGIEPVQSGSGDPSPTNVRPISGWTGANVTRTGKNLLPVKDETYNGNGITITPIKDNDGKIIAVDIHGTATSSIDWWFAGSSNMLTLPRADYYLSTGLSERIQGLTMVIAPGYWGVYTNRVSTDVIISGAFLSIASGTSFNHVLVTPFVCLNSVVDKSFAPYTGTTIPISWQSEAGTVYGGTLDVTTGLLTVDRAKIKPNSNTVVGTNPSSWNPNYPSFYFRIPFNSVADNAKILCISNAMMGVARNQIQSINQPFACSVAGDFNEIDFTSTFQTAEENKQWMIDNNVEFVYLLATPQTYQLTPTEVEMLLGENNVWADTGNSTVIYRADTKLYIQKINAPTDDDMIADAQIASGKYFIVGGNLYKSTTTIPAGDTINPGSNCILTNLADALNALNT